MFHMHEVRRRGVVVVLLVVGMLSTAVGGASAAGWLAPVNVPLSVSDLGFDKDGNAIAVGVGADAGGASTFQSMTRPFSGQWSAPVPVSGIGDSAVRSPQVGVDPHGNAVAVWSADNQGAAKRVIRASSRPAGGQWSDPVVLSDGGGVFASDHEVAIDAQGNATAIWVEFVSPTFVVRAASRPLGGNWGEPVDLSDSSDGAASYPRLALSPQGDATAVWVAGGVVQSKSRPAGGVWSPEVADLSSAGGIVQIAQVVVDPQGNATAVWGLDDSGSVVQAARRVAGGVWSAAVDLGDGNSPQVAVDPQGNATAVWESSPAPSSSAVLSSSRTAAGPWSNPAPMATGDDVARVGYPWVAADPQGNVTAIWARYNSTDVIAQATRHVAGSSSWSPSVDLTVGRPITAIPAAGVDPQGHVSMVWSSTEDPWAGASSVFDPIAPTLGPLMMIARTINVGIPFDMAITASDAWSPVTVSWDFGDGQSGSGTTVRHTWGSLGERTVTITATDAAGNATQVSHRITVEAALVPPKLPDPGPKPGPRPAVKAPVLSGLQQANARWRTHTVRRGRKLPVGTTFRFKLDRAAQVRLAFSQIVAGRRVNGRCVKVTKANRKKSRCSRAQAAGTLTVAGKAGANAVSFKGKLRGRTLKPGSYRLLVTATADGKASAAKSVRFTIAP